MRAIFGKTDNDSISPMAHSSKDYARGDYELLVNVNNQDAGISRCDGFDRRARWRNWPFVIPAHFVNDSVLHIRQSLLTADRDVNMFRFWFYQPTNW